MVAKARTTNWFAIWVSIAAIAALVGVFVIVVTLNQTTPKPPAPPKGGGIEEGTDAILVGTGPAAVDVWLDFYCPHCQNFEATYKDTIDQLLTDEEITLRIYPVALDRLNAASATEFSARSGSALYCVADVDPDAALPFLKAVFALYPQGPGLPDRQLIEIATDVGAEDAADCITAGTYKSFVLAQAAKLPPNPATGTAGTPTLMVNGEYVPITFDPLTDLEERLGLAD